MICWPICKYFQKLSVAKEKLFLHIFRTYSCFLFTSEVCSNSDFQWLKTLKTWEGHHRGNEIFKLFNDYKSHIKQKYTNYLFDKYIKLSICYHIKIHLIWILKRLWFKVNNSLNVLYTLNNLWAKYI